VATGFCAGETAGLPVQTPPPRPPAQAPKGARSACEAHRDWITDQVELGRNAQSIYQDLVERHGFTHRYNSVKRFVRARRSTPPSLTYAAAAHTRVYELPSTRQRAIRATQPNASLSGVSDLKVAGASDKLVGVGAANDPIVSLGRICSQTFIR
jgi:hypothetical protein